MHATPALPGAPARWNSFLLLGLVLVLLATRNLPWHLDDYDQAKQAFVSFEMVEEGQWWFQHTPSGRVATKPPLAGWISAGLFGAMGGQGWELAWRLPAFLSALGLLGLLWQSGRLLEGERGAWLAVAAFAWNLLSPRLATLVRTDMMLTLLIFLAGWLIWRKVRTDTAWTSGERWLFGLVILASMLTKGPIVYAFLLPGLAAFMWLSRQEGRPQRAWCGWLPWTLPLLVFGLWVGIGVALSDAFYQQVVLREFLGRFDFGENPVHKQKPFYFYLPHLVQKWAPWSLLLVILGARRPIRTAVWRDPGLRWLACWAAGGLLVMSLVPSKRVDRIYPILPPLCLLLVGMVGAWAAAPGLAPEKMRRLAAITGAAVVFSAGDSIYNIARSFGENQRALVQLGAQVQKLTTAHPERLVVASASDEGLLLYTQRTRFRGMKDVLRAWSAGEVDWLLVRQRDLLEYRTRLEPFVVRLETPVLAEKQGPYFLLERVNGKSPAPSPGAPAK